MRAINQINRKNNKINQNVYKKILENVRDAFLVAQDDKIKYANVKVLELLGYDSEEALVGSEFKKFIHPDDYLRVLSNHQRRLRGEQFESVYEFNLLRKNGELVPVEIRVAVLEWEGRPATLNFLIDITSRRQAEKELRESEEKYRNLYSYSALGIFHSTFEGRFIDMNPALAKMLGYDSPEEALSLITSIAQQIYLDPHRRDIVADKALKAGGFISLENSYCRRDGSLWYGRLHLRVVPAEQGRPGYYEGFIENITDRKSVEDELKKTLSLLSAICEGSTDAIYVKDIQGRYLLFNREAVRVTGKTQEDVIGKDDRFLFPVDEALRVMAGDRKMMESGKVMTYEEIVTTVEGLRTYLSVKGPLSDDHGNVIGLFGIARDITERKAMTLELERSYKQLQVLNQRWVEIEELERKRLSAELHDELGQNLTALGINFGIVKMNLPPATDSLILNRIDDSLNLLKKSSVHVKNIMSDLRPALLDDYGLVPALRWHVQDIVKRTGIEISCAAEKLPSRLPTEIETALFRIAQEAINNSVKHAEAKSVILNLNYEKNRLRLVIVDDGVGFDVQVISGENFHGWGLMIIRERSIGIKGICRIESNPGYGTKISIEVPL